MDSFFDKLSRKLASSMSRRDSLRLMVSTAASGLLASFLMACGGAAFGCPNQVTCGSNCCNTTDVCCNNNFCCSGTCCGSICCAVNSICCSGGSQGTYCCAIGSNCGGNGTCV